MRDVFLCNGCHARSLHPPPLLHSQLHLCGCSVPRHAVLNMHGSVSPPVASFPLHHSSRYLKESATFALGLNYVQFAKLGLKPSGGGKAL